MTPQIRTILGNIRPTLAGLVDSHDHLFLSTPLMPGGELVDKNAAIEELREFGRFGGGTIVQWTPGGLRRNLAGLAQISMKTGVHIVAATGRHRRAAYGRDSLMPRLSVDELTELFVHDVTNRSCGLIKVGTGYNRICSDEADALHAAAAAHHVTGVPVAIHLEQGSGADLVLSALFKDNVPAHSIVLGHLGRNSDRRYIKDAARSGAWLCLDGPSQAHPMAGDQLALHLEMLLEEGHATQLLLGADTTSSTARAAVSGRGPAGLISDTATQLSQKIGEPIMKRILINNPAEAWQQRGATV